MQTYANEIGIHLWNTKRNTSLEYKKEYKMEYIYWNTKWNTFLEYKMEYILEKVQNGIHFWNIDARIDLKMHMTSRKGAPACWGSNKALHMRHRY